MLEEHTTVESQDCEPDPNTTQEGIFTPILEIDDDIRSIIIQSLKEDIGTGDVTTLATIPEDMIGTAQVKVKETGVLCGAPLLIEVYRLISDQLKIKSCVYEGQTIYEGKVIFQMEGPVRAILTGERVALNILGMMSGVATSTLEHVKAIQHTPVKITDTVKQFPCTGNCRNMLSEWAGSQSPHRIIRYGADQG